MFKFSIKKAKLMKPLRLLNSIADKKSPTYSRLSIKTDNQNKCLIIATGSGTVFGSYKLYPEVRTGSNSVDIEVNSADFLKACTAFPKGKILIFHINESSVVVKTDNHSKVVPILKSSEIVEENTHHVMSFSITGLPLILKKTISCVSKVNTRPYLIGVLFQLDNTNLNIVGTDGHKMCYTTLNNVVLSSDSFDAVLPLDGIKSFLKVLPDDLITLNVYRYDNLDFYFEFESKNVVIAIKSLRGSYSLFPSWKDVVPKNTNSVSVDAKILNKLAVEFADSNKLCAVQFDFNPNDFTCSNPEQPPGYVFESEPQYGSGECFTTHVNGKYLSDVLSVFSGKTCTLKFGDQKWDVLEFFDPEDTASSRFIIMPLRYD